MRTPVFVRTKVLSAHLAPLVARAIEHDESAWHELVTILFPGIEEVAGRFRNAGRLSSSVDERRSIAVAVLARLREPDFDGLKRLHEACAAGPDTAWPWICRVTQRKAYNHVRDHPDNLGPDRPEGAPPLARLVELPEEVEDLLPASVRVVDGIDAHAVLAFAERMLSPRQLAALRLHLLGDSDETIAGALGLSSASAASTLWHGAVKRLRYHFVEKSSGER
jgi:DNA-directed RNA polymerase specialized sigma24 family protein